MDPLKLVMADPRIPEGRAACPACGNRVNPDKRFCSNCGAEYNFRPALAAGDVLAEQYEVKGPIAFGGLGWIYLAMDTRLNRWVVLKGLLNSRDPAAAAAAVAERQFLAAVKHGRIVGIYTFVTHGSDSYIVMEFVGGRTLKAIRRERGPLPPGEAIAYILGILPAFAYLHEQGLVYCDFKPDNVMLEGDDVKLIDMGAVRRIGDPHGDIYGTVGYKAPESDQDPLPVSDLFTIGRTLAVLLMDFDNTGQYSQTLPPPEALLYTVPEAALRAAGLDPTLRLRAGLANGGTLPPWLRWSPESRTLSGAAPAGVSTLDLRIASDSGTMLPVQARLPLLEHPSLYRFLLKATAHSPDARFQSAEEMAVQLTGVLRETVAREAPVPAMESTHFLGERLMPPGTDAWKALPVLRLDQADPAAAELFGAITAGLDARAPLLAAAVRARPQSAEARLRLADTMIESSGEATDFDAVMRLLDQVVGLDPADWRADWYCGKLYLARRLGAEAVECFDKVYGELPGEPAAKLALALALRQAGQMHEAAGYFDIVSRTDPALTEAAFGLAACLVTQGDRAGAVAALARVADSSARASEARLAAVRVLCEGDPGEAELHQAGEILATLTRDDLGRHEAEAALALQAVRQAEAGRLTANGSAVSGFAADPRALRLRAEAALRACARLSDSPAARIAYIDRANAARPRTLI